MSKNYDIKPTIDEEDRFTYCDFLIDISCNNILMLDYGWLPQTILLLIRLARKNE